jgi:hypothetical protein
MIGPLIVAALALLASCVALAVAWTARNDAAATRSELARHRHSHTLQRPEQPARRHGEIPGPQPLADEHAAPATEAMPLVPPGRRRVRDDPQA